MAHTAVALATGDADAERVLGAVLPDLATMARLRVDRAALPPSVAAGVRCHVAADAAFHADATFLAGVAGLRCSLLDAGVGRGPARAASHVGWELLLDGTLVGTDAEAAFRSALDAGDAVVDAFADATAWRAFLHRWRDAAAPLRYDDPSWVADRVHGALHDRPRLRLDAHDVPLLADALHACAADVRAAAPAVIAATAEATSA